MTDPTTLSLADLAAAVVRLGAHRNRCTTVISGSDGDHLGFSVTGDPIDLLLTAANRLPGLVAERDTLRAEVERLNVDLRCERIRSEDRGASCTEARAELHAELRSHNETVAACVGLREQVERLTRELDDQRTIAEVATRAAERRGTRADCLHADNEALRAEVARLRGLVEELELDLRCEKIRSYDRGHSYKESQDEAKRLRGLVERACQAGERELARHGVTDVDTFQVIRKEAAGE